GLGAERGGVRRVAAAVKRGHIVKGFAGAAQVQNVLAAVRVQLKDLDAALLDNPQALRRLALQKDNLPGGEGAQQAVGGDIRQLIFSDVLEVDNGRNVVFDRQHRRA